MSYILDALKKSDQERKQGDVPNLQTIHIPINTEPKAPLGLYGFIIILLLVLAFVIGLVIANKAPQGIVQVPESVSQPVSEPDNQPEKQPIIHSATQPVKNTVVAEQVNGPNEKAKVIVSPEKTAVDVNQQKKIQPAQKDHKNYPAQIAKQENAVDDIGTPKGPSNLNDIPYLHELPDYQQQSVPQMTFAGHVYSSDPANRSVIINDAFMSEGDSVLQGIDVIEITPSGVVFSLHDSYFRMDILQDWSFE